LVTFHKTQPQ